MNIREVMEKLTPGPWVLVDPRHLRECVRIEGAPGPGMTTPPVVCELWEPNWPANARLITAAPALLVELQLALHLLQQPERPVQTRLKRIAVKRGLELIARITGQTGSLSPDPTVLAVLAEMGIIEPALSELALTTTPELAESWVRYAREQRLRPGFVVSQLRAGGRPPLGPAEKSWYTEAERHLIIT